MNIDKHPYLKAQYNTIRQQVQQAVSKVPPHPFGHAFLWGYITLKRKNGKDVVVRDCLGSVCSNDLELTRKLAESVPGVSNVWFNMD